jgi:hypothetical protein
MQLQIIYVLLILEKNLKKKYHHTSAKKMWLMVNAYGNNMKNVNS